MRRKWLSGCLAVCVMAMSMVGLPLPAEASPQEAASTTDVVHNHQDKTWKEWNSYISKINGENMYLTKDLEIPKNNAVNIFGKTTICLNGHQLNCLGQLHIQKGAEVTICDCGTQSREGYIDPDGLWQEGTAPTDGTPYPLKGGVITGHQIVNPVIKNDSGKLLMDSVNIAGNSSTTTEGELIDCVSLKGVLTEVALKNCVLAGNRNQCLTVGEMCKASIEGCKISHNQTSAKGGAIYANRKSCNVELNKTEVRDNTSLRSDWEGSALYITEGCSLTMRDSKVIDNHSENGYGIFCWNNGQLKLGSNSVIHGNGNGGCNVLLNDTPIQLIGPIDHGHKIGVSRKLTQGTVAPKEWTFTKDWNTHMPGLHPAEYFYSEQPGYIVSPNSNDEGIFMVGDTYPIIYKDLGGGTFSGELPEGAVKIHQFGTATVLPEPTKDGYVFKGWYTDYTGNGAPLTEIAETYNQTPVVYAKWVKAVQAPTISKDCSDIHMTQGNEATLLVDVQAEKDATVSYQWYQTNSANDHQNGTAVAGATTNRLTIGRDTPAGTYYYYCVATASRDGLSASTTSKVATVVVNKPALQAPSITEQPTDLTLAYGEEGDLSVQATSPTDDALSYQWYKIEDMNGTTNGSVIDGATQSTLKVGKNAKPGSYYYYCVVTASRDGLSAPTTSKVATVVVNKPALQAPSITEQPTDLTLAYGTEGDLSVKANSPTDDALSYQWYKTEDKNNTTNGSVIDGATQSTLKVGKDAKPGSYYYYCVVTASRDTQQLTTTSSIATVTVNKPALQAPSITEQPTDLTLDYGTEGSLSVQATSPTDDALSYQWFQTEDMNSTTNATAIDGATQSTLKVGKDAKPGSYYYYCVVTASRDGMSAPTTSKVATVVVNKPALQAPIITVQPKNLTLDYGEEGDLSVQATSPTDDALSYQWYKTEDMNSTTNGSVIDGATQSTLKVGKDAKPGSYYYYCVVTASRDAQQLTTTSSIATVTVNKPDLQAPSITEQPTDLTLAYGEEGDLSVKANSPTDDALSYQWYKTEDKHNTGSGVAIDGATQSTLKVGKNAKPGSYYYYCVVTASRDTQQLTTTSSIATVTVNKPDLQAPSIIEQPTDLTLAYGEEGDLSVKANSPTDDALSYQWYKTEDMNSTTNGSVIDGATQSTLKVGKDAKPGSYYYYCVVTASRDTQQLTTTSSIATVTVNKPDLQAPSIIEQPTDLTLAYGEEGDLSVKANSPTDDALSYQWYRAVDKNNTDNATAIDGATQSTLKVGKNAKPGSYYYYCVVTASRDAQQLTTTSSIATVTVNKPALQAPSITEQPTDLTLAYGEEGDLSVKATSPTDDALSYQWYRAVDKNNTDNATAIDGATQSTLKVGKDAKPGSYYYYCVVTASRDGVSESITSNVATVTVNKPSTPPSKPNSQPPVQNPGETVIHPDGSVTTTVTKPNGTTVATTVSPNGDKFILTTYPDGSVEVAVSGTAPRVVTVPVKDVSAGTVPLVTDCNGKQTVVQRSVVTAEGVVLSVNDGDKIEFLHKMPSFVDVPDAHWAKDAISFAWARGLLVGVDDTHFAPEALTTRAMIWNILSRMEGVPSVGGEHWYQPGQEWAMANGVSDGTMPEASITREQLATMLYRYAGSPDAKGDLSDYCDAFLVSDWAQDAMIWAVDEGIVAGMTADTLVPQGTATRAQTAAMLERFIACQLGVQTK